MAETAKLKLIKPEEYDNFNRQVLNGNMDKIDAAIEKLLYGIKGTTGGTDANGIDTIIEYRRQDNTLFLRKTLSNPNEKGQYLKDTWEFFNETGTGTPVTKREWTYGYKASDNSPRALPNSWSYVEVTP